MATGVNLLSYYLCIMELRVLDGITVFEIVLKYYHLLVFTGQNNEIEQ